MSGYLLLLLFNRDSSFLKHVLAYSLSVFYSQGHSHDAFQLSGKVYPCLLVCMPAYIAVMPLIRVGSIWQPLLSQVAQSRNAHSNPPASSWTSQATTHDWKSMAWQPYSDFALYRCIADTMVHAQRFCPCIHSCHQLQAKTCSVFCKQWLGCL